VIDKARAEEIAEAWLHAPERRGSPDLVLLRDLTWAKPYGWVFFYDSREHIETGSISSALAGNAPVLVLRRDGEVRVLGTARPVEEYLADYEGLAGHMTFPNAD
jgi:hypothetical protein